MNLNKCLKTMEYLHATLHFAVLIPLVYAVAELSDPAGTGDTVPQSCLLR